MDKYIEVLKEELGGFTEPYGSKGEKIAIMEGEGCSESATAIIHALAACEQAKQLEKIANYLTKQQGEDEK